MEPTFRTAIIDDIQILLGFIQAFYAEDGDIPYVEEEVRRAAEELILNPDYGEIQLIEIEDNPIGYMVLTIGYSLEFHGKDSFIDELYIIPDYRRYGFGARAIQRAEEIMTLRGIQAIHLEVDHSKNRLQNYYQNAGYRNHHRHLMTKLIK